MTKSTSDRGETMMTHYDPAAEALAPTTELNRLRGVEQLAKELAEIVFRVSDYEDPHPDDLTELVARARLAGLLYDEL